LSKQEELKLGIDDIILKGGSLQIDTADKILKYLDSQGVMLKTENLGYHEDSGIQLWYTKYESLIKE